MNYQELLCSILTLLFASETIGSHEGQLCPAVQRSDVKYFDLKLEPRLSVPHQQTTYVCQEHEVPKILQESDITALAFTPLINNTEVMHHMILFGCEDGTKSSNAHSCGGREMGCRSFIAVWSLGFREKDICLYNNTGVSLGKNGYKALSLQIHWNNHHPETNKTDTSGIRVYYTHRLTRYELGNVQVGQNDIDIPAKSHRHQVSGGCRDYCTTKYFSQPIYLTRTFIHMHSLGVSGRMDHYRNGIYLSTIAYDQTYSYSHPPVHVHERAIQILPGDEVRLHCWFSSDNGENVRNRTIYWGEGVEGEMCYAFVSYFPKTEGFDQCVQYAGYDMCDNYNEQKYKFGECDMDDFRRDHISDLALLENRCSGDKLCSDPCTRSSREIFLHPCMKGRLRVFLERQYLSTIQWDKVHSTNEKIERDCSKEALM